MAALTGFTLNKHSVQHLRRQFPDSTEAVAFIFMIVLAVRRVTVNRPAAGAIFA